MRHVLALRLALELCTITSTITDPMKGKDPMGYNQNTQLRIMLRARDYIETPHHQPMPTRENPSFIINNSL